MQYRCKNCNKLLAKGEGELEIKCPRCKAVNQFGSLTNQNACEHPSKKGNYGCPNCNHPC